jgi:hypothetical protein
MRHSSRTFFQSLIFYSIGALLPILITWAAVAPYKHSYPGEGIGEGIIGSLSLVVGLSVGVAASVYMLKKYLKVIEAHIAAIILTLVTAYISYGLIPGYSRLLGHFEYAMLWLMGTVIFPSIIVTIAIALRKRSLAYYSWIILGCALQLGALIAGTHAFSMGITAKQFVNKVNTLGYTLYVPPNNPEWPQISQIYDTAMTKTSTQIAMDMGSLDLENQPGVMDIYELPRPAELPTAKCGPGYHGESLDVDNINYKCHLVASAGSSTIYAMSYDYDGGLIPGVQEYFILEPTTVIFATHSTNSNDKPRVYDQSKSVNLLMHLVPANGNQLSNRLGGR